MNLELTPGMLLLDAMVAVSTYLCVRHGSIALLRLLKRQVKWYERVLCHQLLLEVDPVVVVWLSSAMVVIAGVLGGLLAANVIAGLLCAGLAMLVPNVVVHYLEHRRRSRLESQLVDGVTSLASGVRAGLNLIQAMELLVRNGQPPISQEFAQLLREYQMGLDLNQAMRQAADRIGSANYRLLFTAIEMHRVRGGDAGESLDRIADSIREIQRLEGKLDAITSQGRTQAWMMAVIPLFFLAFMFAIDREGMTMLFTRPAGRVMLLVAGVLIATAFVWIRKIMTVDI